MTLGTALRALDDRVLGARRTGHRSTTGATDSTRSRPQEDRVSATHPDRETTEHEEVVEREQPRGRFGSAAGNGDGVSAFLSVLWRVTKLVLVALGLLLVLAIAFLVLPTNHDNGVVSTVLSWADHVAGPLKDVFTSDDPDHQKIYNYGLAAVVYFVLAAVVGKLPTGRRSAA